MGSTIRYTAFAFFFLVIPIGIMVYAWRWAFDTPDMDSINRFGFVGSVASIIGIIVAFFITLPQIIEAQRLAAQARDASNAAEVAAAETARDLRNSYYRHSLVNARRLFGDIKAHLLNNNLPLAAFRADDLCECASQLAHVRKPADDDWRAVVRGFHVYAVIFREGSFDVAKWTEFCIFVQDKIDREYEPLE